MNTVCNSWHESRRLLRGFGIAARARLDALPPSSPGRKPCAVCASLGASARRLWRWLRGRPRTWADSPRDQRCLFAARDYPGSRNRQYHLHLPPQVEDAAALPLVVVLHGCRQTDADIRRISEFDEIADRHGFIVIYPWVTAYSGLRTRNCWGWWYSNEIRPGSGEVEDLWQIVEQVCAEYPVDRSRIHVTGLSSGGGMTVAMMVAHAEHIASAAVVAGVAYGENAAAVSLTRRSRGIYKPVTRIVEAIHSVAAEPRRAVPVFIAHSHDDATVGIQAAHNIRDSWVQAYDLKLSAHPVRNGVSHDTPWEHTHYCDRNRRSTIETFFLQGKDHGWYGGAPGAYSYPDAPELSGLIWEFFRTHPKPKPQ